MNPLDASAKALLAEAVDWRLIGILLECPGPGWRERVSSLARETTDGHLRTAANIAMEEANEGLYHSAFGPGGPAPPREATHRDTVQLGYLMSELQTVYNAFGYQPQTMEPLDHISVEAGFVGYLKLKQAYAVSCGDQEAAAVTGEACREFLSEHVASISGPLTELLANSDVEYLKYVAGALKPRSGEPKKRFVVLSPGDISSADEDFGCSTLGEST